MPVITERPCHATVRTAPTLTDTTRAMSLQSHRGPARYVSHLRVRVDVTLIHLGRLTRMDNMPSTMPTTLDRDVVHTDIAYGGLVAV
jgi:hypothetical protein